ncbi:MAG: hypothetical protein PSV13_16905 [Lacunisphaera sp.]|nr:hypothetical protein [Lacunisphaera sp.]
MRPRLLLAVSFLAFAFSGCTTTQTSPRSTPPTVPTTGPVAPAVVVPIGTATIKGSEESSVMLDNFTAFISAVDHHPVAAGRDGWNAPLELKAGRHELTVEFKRGVFSARTQLVVEVVAHANYQLRFTSDAELFGKNSFCDFWIVDLATDQPVTGVMKASVVKGG